MRPEDPTREPIQVAHLARLARGLEAGGIYNGAKLVRALLDRELARASLDAPTAGAIVGAGVASLADTLAANGEEPALVAALRAAADAAATETTLPLAAAPDTWSCRICGRISLGATPRWCPTCEAPAAQARFQVPVWYLEPITPAEALAGLDAGLAALEAILAERSDDALARPPRPGEWSAREALQHLVAAEGLLAARVPRLLEEDEPDLAAAAAWVLPASDEATTATDEPTSVLLARLAAMRRSTLARLRTIPEAAWARRGRHAEWGMVTVTSQAGYFARHLWSHLAQVRAAVEGRVPGERPGD